jgi:KDO2-lipid IV(A) lauroyltransferase
MASKAKSKFLIYAEFIPFWLLWKFIQLLPLKVAYSIVIGLFDLFFLVDSRARRRTISHIKHAGVCTDDASARAMAKRTFREFAMLLVEIIKMHQEYAPHKIKRAGDLQSLRKVLTGEINTTNTIIVTAHYGNWEIAGTAFSEQAGRPMVSIMREFSNPLIGKMILDSRRSGVHELASRDAAGLRQLLKALHDGKNISILIDQHASSAEGVETVFFGQPCRTHKTPALLHLKTGIPILPEVTRRLPGRNFEFDLVFGELIYYTPTGDKEKDIQAITQLCTTALEKLIAEQPDQWLWAHRRWLNINRDRSKRKKRPEKAV